MHTLNNIERAESKKNPMAISREKKVAEKVRQLAEPLCEAEQIELVHVQFQREPAGRVLRLYIDKPGGVNLNDCVNISRQLGDLLDVYLDTDFKYNLEVSSPGLNRPLGRLQDFERFKGNLVRIKSANAIRGRKKFKGVLLGVLDETIILRAHDGREFSIPYSEIVNARLVDCSGETSCS
jgi:ribosome maturation factor RimP